MDKNNRAIEYRFGDDVLTRSFVFHDENMTFRIICSIHGGESETVMPEDTFSVDGELYITKCRVYFGKGNKWYTFRAKDISKLKSIVPARTLSINSDYFSLELSCQDPGFLNTLRDLLMLCRYSAENGLIPPTNESFDLDILPNA